MQREKFHEDSILYGAWSVIPSVARLSGAARGRNIPWRARVIIETAPGSQIHGENPSKGFLRPDCNGGDESYDGR